MATATKKTAVPDHVRRPSDRPRKKVAQIQDIPMPQIEVLDLRSEDLDAEEPDLVEVFRLDGKPYYVDRNVGAGVALRMLRSLKHQGQESAVATMLEELLGEQGFEDLSNFRGLTQKHFAQVLLRCSQVILGDEESGPKA